jgi:hypothetical protein
MKSAISTLMGSTLLAATFVGFSAVNAQAKPQETEPAEPLLCSASNITLAGISYSACEGQFAGNDTGNGTLLSDLNGGLFDGLSSDWSLSGKSDGEAGQFNFSAQNDLSSGTWSINNNLAALFGDDLTATFAVSFKAGADNSGGGYSVYLFENFTITQAQLDSGSISGTFDTLGVAVNQNNGQGRGLSHASLWTFNGEEEYNPPNEIPEPSAAAALGLLAAGMLGMKKKGNQ